MVRRCESGECRDVTRKEHARRPNIRGVHERRNVSGRSSIAAALAEDMLYRTK